MHTDRHLIELVIAGDQAAFATIVNRYQGLLYTFVSTFVGSEQACDVVQFVWLQCYCSLASLHSDSSSVAKGFSLKSWLLRVAKNRCIDELRWRKRHPQIVFSELEETDEETSSVESSLADPDSLPEALLELQDEQDSLYTAILSLSSKMRAVVWLRYSEELTFIEIGRKLQIPPGRAKMSFHRACLKLRVALSSKLERTITSSSL